MTPEEFQYIKRAVVALESGEHNKLAEAKILRTVSEICAKNAKNIEGKLVDKVDNRLYN